MTSITGMTAPLHRRFNQAKALEQIRNRYIQIHEKLGQQIRLLQDDERFREICAPLYEEGHKDWMIIGAIYNVALNSWFRKTGVDWLNRNESQFAVRQFAEQKAVAVLPVEEFLGDDFLRCLDTFHMTCLVTWGFHPRARSVSFEVATRFLRERMKHFEFDLPHKPLFGTPPGGWPEACSPGAARKRRNAKRRRKGK